MSRLVLALVVAFVTIAPRAHAQGTREVTYHAQSVVPVQAKLRFTTMIVLPEGEEILDFVCGDKDYWVISGAQHLAYVKPAKAGAATNLNLVTAAGHIYSFLLTEGPAAPDLKIFVTVDGAFAPAAAAPKLFSAGQMEALRRDAEDARAEARADRDASAKAIAAAKAASAQATEAAITAFRATYPLRLQFPYRFTGSFRPFGILAIFHDGQFTYIRADARELPALYELVGADTTRSTTPNLIHFQVEPGLYVVPKVLEHGYLVLGKHKLVFEIAR